MERKRKDGLIYEFKNKKNKKSIDIIEYMIKNSKEYEKEYMLCHKNTQQLDKIMISEQYDIIQYVLEYFYKHNYYDDIIEYMYDFSCSLPKIDIMKYLIELDLQMGNIIIIHNYIEFIFIRTCIYGFLEHLPTKRSKYEFIKSFDNFSCVYIYP